MQLHPKKTKYKKIQKGRLSKYNFRANQLKFGTIGLKLTKSSTISSRQIEAARQAIARKLNRQGQLWIRIFPTVPITAKPTETRMGKGKGSVSHWCAKINAGTIVFEVAGIKDQTLVMTAFKTGGAKLNVSTKIIF